MCENKTTEIFFKEIAYFRPDEILKKTTTDFDFHIICTNLNLNEQIVKAEFNSFKNEFRTFFNEHSALEHSPPDLETDSLLEFSALSMQSVDSSDSDDECHVENGGLVAMQPHWKYFKHFWSNVRNQQIYSRVNRIHQYVLTILPAQVDCERQFSHMKRIKTSGRSVMNDDLSEALIIIKSSCDLVPNSHIPNIIDRIAVVEKACENPIALNPFRKI